MFKKAYFFTFPYTIIVDSTSLNRPMSFVYKDYKIRLSSPYKSYPYNHDYHYKPVFYIDSKGRKLQLPSFGSVCAYPMYDENLNHLGMLIQKDEVFSFQNAKKLRISNDRLPNKVYGFKPVDTIRFDASKNFNIHTPKFVSVFISHLRNISEQFWIGKPRTEEEGLCIEADISMKGNIGNFQFHSNLIPVIRYNKGLPITFEIWSEAVENTKNNVDIDFAKSLFLDALYEKIKNNNREVVLNIANSLDVTINKFFKLLHDENDGSSDFERDSFVKKYRTHKRISSTYLPGLVSEFLDGLVNLNFKNSNPVHYESIRLFWLNKRNKVAHGETVELEEDEAQNLFDAVTDLTNWINNITFEQRIFVKNI